MKTAIIGDGNVGSHLAKALGNSHLINSRTLEGLTEEFDIILICVSDRAIEETACKIDLLLPSYEGVVAHTSGSTPMKILRPFFTHVGVFYPLQTFSKNIPIENYNEIPIFIEGSDKFTVDTLKNLAATKFNSLYELESNGRKQLHLASVFACNFVNALYAIGDDILMETSLPFDVLKPLIHQTAYKIMYSDPKNCQTGPAKRGDGKIMQEHLNMIENNPTLKDIYKLISNYISANNDIIGKQITKKT